MDKDSGLNYHPSLFGQTGGRPEFENREKSLHAFLDNEFITMLSQADGVIPYYLQGVKDDIKIFADEKSPKFEKTYAAVSIGKFLMNNSIRAKGLVAPIPENYSAWFKYGMKNGDPRAANIYAESELECLGIELNEDVSEEPIPFLNYSLSYKAENRSKDLSGNPNISERITNIWKKGIKSSLLEMKKDFDGWDGFMFREAIQCIACYLGIFPNIRTVDAYKAAKDRYKDLIWIQPLWDELLKRVEHDCLDRHQKLCFQQYSITVMLESMSQNKKSFVNTEAIDFNKYRIAGESAFKDSVTIITEGIPATSDRGEKDMLSRCEILTKPLDLVGLPSIEAIETVFDTLKSEFPWAENVVEQAINPLRTARYHGANRLVFSPILLVGYPGAGKTRFAKRFAELMQIPNAVINLAGMRDTMLLKGCARGWSSARPSNIIETIVTKKVANPLFILDEIDKMGASAGNGGDPHFALLDLLEPNNSENFLDVFVLSPCNLSHCMYIATANSLENIPGPLLDRLNPVFFSEPGEDHADVIIDGIVSDMETRLGLPSDAIELNYEQRDILRGLKAREIRKAIENMLGEPNNKPTLN